MTSYVSRARHTRLALILAAALFALAVPSSALAAPSWLNSVPLSAAGQNAFDATAAMDDAGNAVVVWRRYNGTHWIVQAAFRHPGGSFSAPADLSDPNVDSFEPHVAFDSNGNAIAIWRQGNPVVLATAPSGQGFGSPVVLSDAASQALAPSLAVNKAGVALVAWVLGGNVQTTTRSASGAFPPAPQSLTTAGGVNATIPYGGPRAAINEHGDAVVVWDRSTGGTRIVESAYRPAGAGTFEAVQNPGPGGSTGAVYPDPAIDPQGNVTVVWEDCTSGNGCDQVKTNFRPKGSTQSYTGVEIIQGPTSSFEGFPRVEADGDGTAIAVWMGTAGGSKVWAAVRPLNRSFGTPEPLSSSTGDTRFTDLLITPSGTAIALWSRALPAGYTVQAITRPRGGSWGAVSNVSTGGVYSETRPGIGIDSAGDAIAAWVRNDGTNYLAEAAGFDAAGPIISGLSLPSNTIAGHSAAFSANVVDVWSSTTVNWNFGDTATGDGTAPSHTYAVPGSYPVTLTATDALGNASSAGGTVSVSPPPVVDADGDGSPASVDCNDNNPGIHPGAVDVPGNGVDEDCINGDAVVPTPHYSPAINNSWFLFKKYTVPATLNVAPIEAGTVIKVTCKGKGCRFKSKTLKFKKAAKKGNLLTLFNKTVKKKHSKKKHRIVSKLAIGTSVEIRITVPGKIGKFIVYKMKSRKIPAKTSGCLALGTNAKVAC